VILYKTFETIIGGNGYVFYVLSSGSPMLSWDCVGMKTLRRRKKANGLKREINAICLLRNLKPLFDEKGRCGQNFGGLWLMLV
jgi:hypothetical protein